MPFLHNNSSTIESTFSTLRATNKDTAISLEKGLLGANFKASQKLASSALHSADHSTAENKDLHSLEFDLTLGPKKRQQWFDDLVAKRKVSNNDEASGPQTISSFPPLMTGWKETNHWIEFIGSHEGASDFSDVMVTSQAFRDFAEPSTHKMGTKMWFEKIIIGDNNVESNRLCQRMNEKPPCPHDQSHFLSCETSG